MKPNQIYCGDCLEIMQTLPDNHFDTIITDPPYGLKFMGKGWDHGTPGLAYWQEALRVAKPGAILLAFGGDRTHHRLMVAIEDAGWELRTCIYWVFGSGFPKSLNINKAIQKSSADVLCACESHCQEIAQGSQDDCQSLPHSCDEPPLLGQDNEQGELPLSSDAHAHNHVDHETGGQASGQANTCFDEEIFPPSIGYSSPPSSPPLINSPVDDNAPSDISLSKSFFLQTETRKTETRKFYNSDLERDLASSSLDTPNNKDVRNPYIPHCTTCGKLKQDAFSGWGTALKPAAEIIVMAMKPIEKNFAYNAQKWGCAGLWIDGGRIGTDGEALANHGRKQTQNGYDPRMSGPQEKGQTPGQALGRYPANIILDDSEETRAGFPVTGRSSGGQSGVKKSGLTFSSNWNEQQNSKGCGFGDSGSAARFFYTAKAPKSERWFTCLSCANVHPMAERGQHQDHDIEAHPTQKPLGLLKYLARLTKTPTGGLVLDPFAGTGTTALACLAEGRDYVLIEKSAAYTEIIKRRIQEAPAKQLELPE